jgi:hypothetical protein
MRNKCYAIWVKHNLHIAVHEESKLPVKMQKGSRIASEFIAKSYNLVHSCRFIDFAGIERQFVECGVGIDPCSDFSLLSDEATVNWYIESLQFMQYWFVSGKQCLKCEQSLFKSEGTLEGGKCGEVWFESHDLFCTIASTLVGEVGDRVDVDVLEGR